ncbi:MAG: hypothetical protein ACXWYM_00430 [Candidatus Binatia bacterium]
MREGIIDKRKSVAWAYPSSTNATKYGFGKTGCYVVEVTTYKDGQFLSQKVVGGGFMTLADAEAVASPLPMRWCSCYLLYPPRGSRVELRIKDAGAMVACPA